MPERNTVWCGDFYTLADVRPQPVDDRLRRIGGIARLMIDVVTHDEIYTPSVPYATRISVVCDTLYEAHRELGKDKTLLERNAKVSLDRRLPWRRFWTVVSDSS